MKKENVFVSNEDEKALYDFMLDIECLDSLAQWTNKFNIFDVLKISRTEIRHSNMLSWLMNPAENHGLGDYVLRGFVHFILSNYYPKGFDVFKTLLMDFSSFAVYREWKNIDIIAVSDKENFVLCIENKVDSFEHSDQLNRYRDTLQEHYRDYKVLYVFLTPNGYDSTDSENWYSMSYKDVLEIIVGAREKFQMLPDVKILVDNYIDTIRRDIVGDEKLKELCMEIYKKHSKALDLIYENRPDPLYNLAEIFKKWCSVKSAEGLIEYNPDNSVKTCIPFTTSSMSQLIPLSSDNTSVWKTNNFYRYEFRNRKDNVKVALVVNSTNIPDEIMGRIAKIAETLKVNIEGNWTYKTLKTWVLKGVDEEKSEAEIFKACDECMKNIRKFEQELIEKKTAE